MPRGLLASLFVCLLFACQRTDPQVTGASSSDATPKSSENASADAGAFQERLQAAKTTGDLEARATLFSDAMLSDALAIRNLTRLCLYQRQVGAADLSGLVQLDELQRLRLDGFAVDDRLLDAVSGMQQLTVLNLPNADFSDDGLRKLATLPKLELLRFASPHATAEGLAAIAKSRSLRFLHLLNVPITDAGLSAFQSLPHLESLYIDGGQETEDGIRALLKSNPGLHFHRNQLHVDEDPNADGH